MGEPPALISPLLFPLALLHPAPLLSLPPRGQVLADTTLPHVLHTRLGCGRPGLLLQICLSHPLTSLPEGTESSSPLSYSPPRSISLPLSRVSLCIYVLTCPHLWSHGAPCSCCSQPEWALGSKQGSEMPPGASPGLSTTPGTQRGFLNST